MLNWTTTNVGDWSGYDLIWALAFIFIVGPLICSVAIMILGGLFGVIYEALKR